MAQISRLREAEIANGNLINADDLDAELDQLVSESNSQDTRLTGMESGNVTLTGTKTFSSAPKLDQIDERSVNSGVTIDSVLLKDGAIRVPGSSGYTPTTNGDLGYDAASHTYDVYVNGTPRSLMHDGNMLHQGAIVGPPPRYNNAASIIIPAGLAARADDNTTDMIATADITLSLASGGAAGLDTGSETANTWYYVYLIKNSTTGDVSAVFSITNEVASGNITLPSGYDKKRQLPFAVRNDAGSNILKFYVREGWPHRPVIILDLPLSNTNAGVTGTANVVSGGTASTFTSVSLGNYVPVGISHIALIHLSPTGNNSIEVRSGDDTGSGFVMGVAFGSGGNHRSFRDFIRLDPADGTIDYKLAVVSGSANIDVLGFVVTEVN